MKTVTIESLLVNRMHPRCVKFRVGEVSYSAIRRKRKNYACQFFEGPCGDVAIIERTLKPEVLCEVADDVL